MIIVRSNLHYYFITCVNTTYLRVMSVLISVHVLHKVEHVEETITADFTTSAIACNVSTQL